MAMAVKAVDRFAGKKVGKLVLTPLLAAIKVRYGFKSLDVFQSGPNWWIAGALNPEEKVPTKAKVGEGGAAAGPKTATVVRATTTLGGDTVGVSMTADWLDAKHPAGSAPQSSAQQTLMDLLVTDPSKSAGNKFIRGHLLNEHLGGLGNAENMFPITGYANSQHLHSTEKRVKGWMAKPDRWTFYEVKVINISSTLDPKKKKSAANYVECTFSCHAILKDETGKAEENFSTSIPSVYGDKQKATKVENLPDAPAGKPSK
jgi:hypothetical protein